jgi:hypothetical protein
MLREITKFSALYEQENEEHGGTMGMFSPTPQIIRGQYPGVFTSNIFGTMFLNLDDVDDEIITHECCHAAFARERDALRFSGNHKDMADEERYCYYAGEITRRVKSAVRDARRDMKRG